MDFPLKQDLQIFLYFHQDSATVAPASNLHGRCSLVQELPQHDQRVHGSQKPNPRDLGPEIAGPVKFADNHFRCPHRQPEPLAPEKTKAESHLPDQHQERLFPIDLALAALKKKE